MPIWLEKYRRQLALVISMDGYEALLELIERYRE
jgi:hypothetical protein